MTKTFVSSICYRAFCSSLVRDGATSGFDFSSEPRKEELDEESDCLDDEDVSSLSFELCDRVVSH